MSSSNEEYMQHDYIYTYQLVCIEREREEDGNEEANKAFSGKFWVVQEDGREGVYIGKLREEAKLVIHTNNDCGE